MITKEKQKNIASNPKVNPDDGGRMGTSAATTFSAGAGSVCRPFNCIFFSKQFPSTSSFHHHPPLPFPLKVRKDASGRTAEVSEADKIVDGMDFGDLCNDFECISSPLVESTARQLARDILELRQDNRTLATFAVSVKYKDPVRSFTGREKYNRPVWVTKALDDPSVTVQEMVMLSTSVLSIKWTIKGRPKSLLANIVVGGGGHLILRVNSQFTLNQISGQVIEHQEFWDLSESSAIAQAFFWASRRLFAATEAGKDLGDSLKNWGSSLTTQKENLEIYPDPSGDPTKFFQRDDSFQQDLYQITLFLAVLYFVVQFLRTTL